MNTFSDELRKTRETLNISLSDIARKTRINIKYLEALERGTFDILPQTYIRAFIKAYSEAVGADANEMLKKYEITVLRKFDSTTALQSPADLITDSSFKDGKVLVTEEDLIQQTRTKKIIYNTVLITLGVLIVFYFLYYIIFTAHPPGVTETPFQEIVQEQESKILPPATADTVITMQTTPAVLLPESLILHAAASDSVWITIRQDTKAPRYGYLLNGSRREWKAKDSITISLSNAGAIRFTLNGKNLGSLGAKGKPVRSYKITMDTLAAKMQ